MSKGKADQFALGYVHNLSKRTSVYGTYAYIKNKDGANLYNAWALVVRRQWLAARCASGRQPRSNEWLA
jgi:predicted porin